MELHLITFHVVTDARKKNDSRNIHTTQKGELDVLCCLYIRRLMLRLEVDLIRKWHTPDMRRQEIFWD